MAFEDFDFDALSPEAQAEAHQEMIQLGEALQRSPKIRSLLIQFVQSNSRAFASIPDESLDQYTNVIDSLIAGDATEQRLRRRIHELEERLRWAELLGDTSSWPPEGSDWNWDTFFGMN